MSDVPKLRVRGIRFSVLPTRTRFPFRYGIAAMTSAPHWFVRSELEIDGRAARGIASEGLPPKWFTKNPSTTFEEDDLPAMVRVIRQAAAFAESMMEPLSFFRFWMELRRAMETWADENGIPRLLAQLGTALMERTVLDGLCRHLQMPFHEVVRRNLPGLEPGGIHPELRSVDPAREYSEPPLDNVHVRHTVGLADPLSDSDIAAADRVDDGLPQSLAANIHACGLTHFKLKMSGTPETDRERFRELSKLLSREAPRDFKVTIDGNEQYADIGSFREDFLELRSDPAIAPLFDHLLFVEQPVHRDSALDDPVRSVLNSWSDAPPIIIDESDASLESLPRALELGYAGTSHKNCKGVMKSLVNAALIRRRGGVMSAEDLANLGPVALLQDLAVVALLGIGHVERNGHHYFAGLSMFSEELRNLVLDAHPDLYEDKGGDLAALKIVEGVVSTRSINAASFGVGLDVEAFDGVGDRV